MKQSSLPKSSRLIIGIAVIVLILAIILGIFTLKNVTTTASNNSQNNQALNSSTLTPIVTTDPYAGWKDYYFEQYDISFKYPADWIVTIDRKEEQPGGADKLLCFEGAQEYFKDYKKCNNQLIYAYRLTVAPPSQMISEGVNMTIFGNGGNDLKSNSYRKINNNNYEAYISKGILYVNNIEAGKNSIFKKYNTLSFNYEGNQSLLMEELILKSIK